MLGQFQEFGDVALAFQIVKERADTVQIGQFVSQQIGAAPHDQPVIGIAVPHGKTGGDQGGGDIVQLTAGGLDLVVDAPAQIGQRAPLGHGVQEIRRLTHGTGGMLRKNKYCWIYAGIMGLYQTIVGFGAGSYYFTYIVGDVSKLGLVSVLSVVLLPVMFIFPTMMRKMSVAKLFVIFSAISVIGYVIVFIGGGNFPVVMAGLLLATLLNLPLGYLGALVVMQLATYNEYMGLPRMEGSSGVVSGFASKVGGGLGAGLCGILLGASGFISSTTGTVAQPETALFMIRALYSIIPAVGSVLIVILSVMLGKLGKQIPMMEEEVARRKETLTEKAE